MPQESAFTDIVLEKQGQFADLVLDKENPIDEIDISLTWNVSRGGDSFDADLIIPQLVGVGRNADDSILRTLLGRSGRNISYFGNLVTADGAIHLDKDDRTGESGENAKLFLSRIAVDAVDEIPVIATINDATAKGGQTWANMEAVLTLSDKASGRKICHYNLGDKFPNDDTVMIGSFMRTAGKKDWRFILTAHGFNAGAGGVMRALQAMWSTVPAKPL